MNIEQTRAALEWQAREMEEGWHPEIPLEIAERADLFRALSAALGRATEAWLHESGAMIYHTPQGDPWQRVLIVPIEGEI